MFIKSIIPHTHTQTHRSEHSAEFAELPQASWQVCLSHCSKNVLSNLKLPPAMLQGIEHGSKSNLGNGSQHHSNHRKFKRKLRGTATASFLTQNREKNKRAGKTARVRVLVGIDMSKKRNPDRVVWSGFGPRTRALFATLACVAGAALTQCQVQISCQAQQFVRSRVTCGFRGRRSTFARSGTDIAAGEALLQGQVRGRRSTFARAGAALSQGLTESAGCSSVCVCVQGIAEGIAQRLLFMGIVPHII